MSEATHIDAAFIDPSKIRDYLLSVSHPIGRFKALFFMRLGYDQENWVDLERDILELVRREEATIERDTPYGRKFRVCGILRGPSGVKAEVVTIWIVLTKEGLPRFITAFRGGSR